MGISCLKQNLNQTFFCTETKDQMLSLIHGFLCQNHTSNIVFNKCTFFCLKFLNPWSENLLLYQSKCLENKLSIVTCSCSYLFSCCWWQLLFWSFGGWKIMAGGCGEGFECWGLWLLPMGGVMVKDNPWCIGVRGKEVGDIGKNEGEEKEKWCCWGL